ncbi:cell wall-binding repeat-containing protein [Micromonospora inositola]|uniref:WD40-like Beta Propeller Repeat n=1 Tax=Micromonospora inositola TaxID=47865 RepID=A0A1C5HT39_9ACTN|nr:cell wall-binding repeat-containing protein [Micromonospora inositola]SCG49152.1 WD40-like Beta Propeller Repeat [Micromonospora inositola]
MGSTALIAGAPAATASLPGTGEVLTVSNSTTSLKFLNDSSRTTLVNPLGDSMLNASWSPDGSRAAYVDQDGGITSIRWNASGDLWYVAVPEDGVLRNSPSYRGDGSSVVWAEKAGTGKWMVRIAPSSSGFPGGHISPDDGQHYLNPDGGPGMKVVFQRQADNGAGNPTGTPAVILYDFSNGAAQTTVVDDNGSNPSLSPDGTKVAFVRDGQIIVSDLTGGNEVVVASNAGHDNPTWSPNGTKIAFSQGSTIATALADGSQAANPAVVSTAAGVPAYQPRNKDRSVRLSGSSRFTTAAAVSQSHWKTVSNAADTREQAQAVVLSRSDTFADALSGSALAAAKRGPLLLTPPTSLEATSQAELQRTLTPGGTVYLLGSPGAISTTVEDAVKALGYTVVRLAGTDRFSTSVAIAKAIDPTPDLVLLATGMNYPDALAAGAAAGSYDYPGSGTSAVVLLTNDSTMPAATKGFLDTLPAGTRDIAGIGLFGANAAAAYDPNSFEVSGTGRYETALFVAWTFFGGENHIGLATGTNWPDALSGGALMGLLNGPLLLTPGTATTLGAEAQALLDESSGSVHTALIFGSSAVVSSNQQSQAGTWIGGPLGSSLLSNSTDIGLSSTARTADSLRVAGATTVGSDVVRTPEQAAAAAESLPERTARR